MAVRRHKANKQMNKQTKKTRLSLITKILECLKQRISFIQVILVTGDVALWHNGWGSSIVTVVAWVATVAGVRSLAWNVLDSAAKIAYCKSLARDKLTWFPWVFQKYTPLIQYLEHLPQGCPTLSSSNVLFYFILTTILWGKNYYSVLGLRTPWLREVKYFAQHHTFNKWKGQNFKSDSRVCAFLPSTLLN